MMKRGCAVLVTSKSQSKIRISDEPAFVLHRYDWSESSLVLDVFTRHLGRLALVAKGCLLYTSPSPRDRTRSRMPSSA